MAKTAVILGGSGFIGAHLLRFLVAQGRHSHLVSLDLKRPHEMLPGVQYETADLCEEIPTSYGCENATIYNLVAIRNFPGHPDQQYYDVNVVSTQRAIDFAERIGASTIVFTSTMSVYGPGEDPKTEESSLAPINPYGASKRICELLHSSWLARNPSCRLITCRPAVIFGYRDAGNFTRLARALERGVFVFVGRRNTIKSSGYVEDLVRSFTYCLDRPEREILYNFAYPKSYTIQAVVDAFCEVGRYRRPRFTLPLTLLNLAAIPFEIVHTFGMKNPIHRDRIRKLYESTNIVPRWLVENGFEFKTDLKEALGKWKAESPGGRFV